MDTGLTWASVASKLQGDYDLYMLDTRGHGLSDPFNGSEDSNTLLKDVVAAAQVLGLHRPILMGHSMGGATVIRLGAEYPDFAKAIIVVDAGIGVPGRPSSGAQRNPPPPSSDRMPVTMRGSPEALVAQNNYPFDDLVAKAHRENPRWSMTDCEYWAVAIKRYHGPYSDKVWQAMSGTMRSQTSGGSPSSRRRDFNGSTAAAVGKPRTSEPFAGGKTYLSPCARNSSKALRFTRFSDLEM